MNMGKGYIFLGRKEKCKFKKKSEISMLAIHALSSVYIENEFAMCPLVGKPILNQDPAM